MKFIKTVSMATLALTISLGATFTSSALVKSLDSNDLAPISHTSDSSSSTYTFDIKDEKELEEQLENELNKAKSTKNYDLVYAGYSNTSTGAKKISGQPSGGVSFQSGGQIYYKDGSSYSVPLSVSIAGQTIPFSVGIGTFSKSPTTYGINIPGGNVPYHAYANKTYKVTLYKKYFVNPATGKKTFQGYENGKQLQRISFTHKRV